MVHRGPRPRATVKHLAGATGSLSIVSARTTTNYRAWNNFYGIYALSWTRSLLLRFSVSLFLYIFLSDSDTDTFCVLHRYTNYFVTKTNRSQGALLLGSFSYQFQFQFQWLPLVLAWSFLSTLFAADRHLLANPLSPVSVANY